MSENIIDAMQTSTAKSTLHSAASRRARFVVLALALILVGAAAISLLLGRYPIDPAQAVAMLVSKIVPVDPIWTEQQATLFFNVRLPRILLALMVGCCLACAGAAYQGTFQNPLVSPDILGASQGAAFGAAVAILLGVSSFTTSLFAFGFSLFTVLLVLLISSRARGNHMMVVVLAGVMVSSLFLRQTGGRPHRRARRHHLLAHGIAHGREHARHRHGVPHHARRLRHVVRPALAHQHPHDGRRRGGAHPQICDFTGEPNRLFRLMSYRRAALIRNASSKYFR